MDDKNITLNGGKTITVILDSGATESVKVLQIKVRQYESAFPLVADEPALVGLLCGKEKAWALMLTSESYEAILETGREVNQRGFFSYCQRRTELQEKQNAAMIGMMAGLPPETIKTFVDLGKKSPLLNSPPGFVPRPER
jgi:hypothetical protein